MSVGWEHLCPLQTLNLCTWWLGPHIAFVCVWLSCWMLMSLVPVHQSLPLQCPEVLHQPGVLRLLLCTHVLLPCAGPYGRGEGGHTSRPEGSIRYYFVSAGRDPSFSKWCSQSAPSQLPVSLAKAKPISIPPQPSCCPTSAGGQAAHPTSTSQTSPPSTNLLWCLRDSTRPCVSVKMLMSLEVQGITNHEQLTLRCLSSSKNQ